MAHVSRPAAIWLFYNLRLNTVSISLRKKNYRLQKKVVILLMCRITSTATPPSLSCSWRNREGSSCLQPRSRKEGRRYRRARLRRKKGNRNRKRWKANRKRRSGSEGRLRSFYPMCQGWEFYPFLIYWTGIFWKLWTFHLQQRLLNMVRWFGSGYWKFL
jgi:hypothetical protein